MIIFPGQGYFDLELLKKKYVKDFCYEYGLKDIFETVSQDTKNMFYAKYAQVIIVATEVAQYLEYSNKYKENNNILVGYSLGEISSLIANRRCRPASTGNRRCRPASTATRRCKTGVG